MLEVESLSSSPTSSAYYENIRSNEDAVRDPLAEKIIELFHFCDVEGKGYVVKADLYRLKDELGLAEGDVDYAFDQLDTNHDSFLSMAEFTTGFGLFVGVQQPAASAANEDAIMTDETSAGIKLDFSFQVFNLIDKDDKGHITKKDLCEASDTLEINASEIDYLFSRLRTTNSTDDVVYFEEFANNISWIVALSPALQEIKELEEKKEQQTEKLAIIGRAFKMDLSGYEENEIEQLLHEQATILFKRCDYGNKNFVTLSDLRTLASELELSDEQVTEAFHRLNVKDKDYLTLREFVNGFGLFLGIEQDSTDTPGGGGGGDVDNDELDKAMELFNACDANKHGYVTLYDLQQLTGQLGLSGQQIEDIFKELDDDDNGFITLDEFVNGFSSFTKNIQNNSSTSTSTSQPVDETSNRKSQLRKERTFDEIYFMDSSVVEEQPLFSKPTSRFSRSESEQSRNNFIHRQMSMHYESGVGEINGMLDSIEQDCGSSISKDQLSELWSTVSSTSDSLTAKRFEDFLGKVYAELRTAKLEAKHLEGVLEKKSLTHTEEIKKIYDEMETQIQTEKLKQRQQLAEKETMFREDLLRELHDKEKEIEKFMQRENSLQNRLETVKKKETSLKHQYSKLQKEKSQLEDRLNDSMSNESFLKSSLHHMEEQTAAEKKETLRAAVQATQGIQSEHENLVKQLDLLRAMNHKLRDDRDALESTLRSKTKDSEMYAEDINAGSHGKQPLGRTGSNLGGYISDRKSTTPTHSKLVKQGSVMSNYFGANGDMMHSSVFDSDQHMFSINETDLNMEDPLETMDKALDLDENTERCARSSFTHSEDSGEFPPPSSPTRHPPVGMNDEERFSDNVSSVSLVSLPPETPNRVYKIVFVGDSGVGKSSFIHRFCFEDFQKNFSATIGVDFQVKTIKVKRQWIALQLWDTAGQERFRSITKQYFRRADGVVIMFDLTSEDSFLNVKSWMFNVQDGADTDCQIMLVGNKKDLCTENPKKRKISVETATKTAEDYNALYEEVSALSGDGVLDSMNRIAVRMATNEDFWQKNSCLNLRNLEDDGVNGKKNKCC